MTLPSWRVDADLGSGGRPFHRDPPVLPCSKRTSATDEPSAVSSFIKNEPARLKKASRAEFVNYLKFLQKYEATFTLVSIRALSPKEFYHPR